MIARSCQPASAADLYVVDIRFVSGYLSDKEAARLRNLLDEIEQPAGFWKTREDKEERIFPAIGNMRPDRRDRNILGVKKVGAVARDRIDKVSRLPDADEHILPFVLKVTVYIHEGVIRRQVLDACQRFNINPWFDNQRRLRLLFDHRGIEN